MRLVTFRAPQEEMVGRLEGDRVVALQAPSMLDWLRGDGRDEAGAEHALADIELLVELFVSVVTAAATVAGRPAS